MKTKLILRWNGYYAHSRVNRELLTQHIAGYSTSDRYLYLVPKEGKGIRLRISRNLEHMERLEEWVASRFPNLDRAEAVQPARDRFSPADRLRLAKWIAYALTTLSVIASTYSGFSATHFRYCTITLLLIMPMALLLLYFNTRLLRLPANWKKQPAIIFTLFANGVGLINVGRRFSVISNGLLWVITIASLVVLGILFFHAANPQRWKQTGWIPALIMLLIAFLGYGYGGTLALNRITDHKATVYYETKVINKWTSTRPGSITYELDIAPWGLLSTLRRRRYPVVHSVMFIPAVPLLLIIIRADWALAGMNMTSNNARIDK